MIDEVGQLLTMALGLGSFLAAACWTLRWLCLRLAERGGSDKRTQDRQANICHVGLACLAQSLLNGY